MLASEKLNNLEAAIKSTPEKILNGNILYFVNNYSTTTDILIEALYHAGKLYDAGNIAKLDACNLLQHTEQFVSERGWNQNQPALASLIYLNDKRVMSNDGTIRLPAESVADVWDTLWDKAITQLKTTFHIEYTPFEQQLNNTERWRLEEIIDNRYEGTQNKLERLQKYESKYSNLPRAANLLLPLVQVCKDENSEQALSELLTVHLNYAGLMKNCPDYKKLATEAQEGNWLGDELINKATLYQGVISHADSLIQESKEKLSEILNNQNNRTISGEITEAPKYGRSR